MCNHNNILPEPSTRNTAAAIGYAAFSIMKRYGDGIMCIYPADHYIKNETEFTNILNKAIKVAEENEKIVTIGIAPTFPSAGYWYINFDKKLEYDKVAYDVVEFVEKTNYEIANKYANKYDKLEKLSQFIDTELEYEKLKEIYLTIPSISIDYGIMERSNDVVVVTSDFGWNDVGRWDVLGAIYPTDGEGNIKRGETITIDTKDCIVYSEDKLIATVGVKDLIVVSTEDAVMVCKKDKAQDVKK